MAEFGIVLNYALLYGAILLTAALGGYLCERAGIVNVGIDGMMCFGAVFYGIFSSQALHFYDMGNWGLIFALLLGSGCTMLTGVMHAYATINLKANHVISGTAINLIGVAFATFVNIPLGNSLCGGESCITTQFTDFGYIGNSVFASSIILFVVALLIAVAIFVVINFTKLGLRYKAIGENPAAVDSLGINVTKYQWVGVVLGSALAGLAGGLFLFSINRFQGNTQGLGYLALAIMIIGGWRTEWITVASIIFALFTSLSLSNTLVNAGFPKEVAFSLPYVLTFIVLIFFGRWVKAPEHDGIPYDKSNK